MSDSNSSNIKTGWVLAILIGIVLLVVGFYFFNFNSHLLKNENWPDIFKNLSKDTGIWGTFGDYVGGILNPVIAAFAFYLIDKTYNLQKTELEETRKLLEISTKAQDIQMKLAALTVLHNLYLTRVSALEEEKTSLYEREAKHRQPFDNNSEVMRKIMLGTYGEPETYSPEKMNNINSEIKRLKNKNAEIEEKIEAFDL